jgi:hypothetical protein
MPGAASINHEQLISTASYHHFSNEVGMIDTIKRQFSCCGGEFCVGTVYASATS